jgi:hypothetical protein
VDGTKPISEKDLRNWKLLEDFQTALDHVYRAEGQHPTFDDPRRKLTYSRYLSLLLFGLFNPVVKSMRALCAASRLPRVQEEICGVPVSLGSFSETQRVLDPELLHQVFTQLAAQVPGLAQGDPRLARLNLVAQDGSLWRALPRMAWAEYGVGCKGDANGVRLHLRFHLHSQAPIDARVDVGKSCERKALRQMCQPGQTSVGDRCYGGDYRLFYQIERAKGFFVFRIKDTAVVHVDQELPLTQADRDANVVRHAWVYLGDTDMLRSIRVRLIEIRTATDHLLLVTNWSAEAVPAELVSAIYRQRWSIELFFRWIKCILGCRHFFAESPQGVAIQLYLALIAAVLVQLWTGRRPSKRTMELIQFFQMGWATQEDLERLLPKYAALKTKKA